MSIVADGSAAADARDQVRIDPEDDADALRYRCPNGHSSWEPTNSHIWCHACHRASEHDESIDAEHYAIIDERTGEEISWGAVEIEW